MLLGQAAFGQSGANGSAAPADEPTTFNKDIAPIIFQHCARCHHPGEVAPFSLLTYEDAQKRAEQIAIVTQDRFMPPWKSVEGHGRFQGERRLKSNEIELIARWVKQGAVEGDRRDLPKQPVFAEGWQLGTPDIILTMPEAYQLRADGPDDFRNFIFELKVPEGKYIKAAEFRPSNRLVVHHAVLMMFPLDVGRKKDEADVGPGFQGAALAGPLLSGSMATWTPGRDPSPLRDGYSVPWPAGMGLLLQLHLHPSGKPETEQSSIGLYLTDEPPQRSMVDMFLVNTRIDIPPGDSAYRARDEFTLPIEMEALGIFPHMHLIGRDIKVTAQPPDQKEPFSLIWINDWDFNWQGYYQYETPVTLPAGTRIVMETVHDNSADNIRNPNSPPKRIRWGEQTTDEMSVAILQLVPVREDERGKLATHRERILSEIAAVKAGNQGGE
jgi:hypothetical protein